MRMRYGHKNILCGFSRYMRHTALVTLILGIAMSPVYAAPDNDGQTQHDTSHPLSDSSHARSYSLLPFPVALGGNAGHAGAFSTCTYKMVRVHGSSMAPVIAAGSTHPAIFGHAVCLGPFKRDDIVLLRNPSSDAPLLKRIIAKTGDRFTLQNNYLVINGDKARNSAGTPYRFDGARADMLRLYINDYNGRIPEDTFLLLGERPHGSQDSSRLGLISKSAIIARLVNHQ